PTMLARRSNCCAPDGHATTKTAAKTANKRCMIHPQSINSNWSGAAQARLRGARHRSGRTCRPIRAATVRERLLATHLANAPSRGALWARLCLEYGVRQDFLDWRVFTWTASLPCRTPTIELARVPNGLGKTRELMPRAQSARGSTDSCAEPKGPVGRPGIFAAFAQLPSSTARCQVSTSPVQVRAEGLTERLGDIVLQCSGSVPGAVFTGNFTLYLP